MFDVDVGYYGVSPEPSELAGIVYDVEDYKAHVIWKLNFVVSNVATFDDRPLFYFREAVILLRRFRASGYSCEKCITALGCLIGAIAFLRDYVTEHDRRGVYVHAISVDVDSGEFSNAVAQLRRSVCQPESNLMQIMADALAATDLDDGLFHLLAIMQMKNYYLCNDVRAIMQLKKGDMN